MTANEPAVRSPGPRDPHDVRFFTSREEFWRWLDEHHATEPEVWVGFHHRKRGVPSLTWEESVDAALCFGWIDGIRKNLGPTSSTIRFTPRRRTSNWSAKNLKRMGELETMGLMRAAGRAAHEGRDRRRDAIYSYEREAAAFTPEQEARFRADGAAWACFMGQAPSYRKGATYWVASAKQEATRERRLTILIEASATGTRPGALIPPGRSRAGSVEP